LVNENFPAPAIGKLRAAGFDVFSISEEMPGATDEAVLEKARFLGRWLVTFDRDYGELVFLRGLPSPPSIIYLRQEPVSADTPADWLIELLSGNAPQPGYFITLSSTTVRQRALVTRA
jgi:predicted nuclease of predicted toxin-antitoxin system